MESLRFMSEEQVRTLQNEFETPFFAYDQRSLEQRARQVLAFPSAFGLTGRYAMKALPNAAVLRVLSEAGLHIDASSGFEAERAMRAGVAPEHIQLTAQELPRDLAALVERGVLFNACSLSQLAAYGELFPGSEVSVRINPGLGSGHSNRTNVGGPSASFGIWHELLDELLETAARHRLRIARMHTHIGSGSDPDKWVVCARMSLDIAARLPEVTTLSLGGGFKVARMAREDSTDLVAIGQKIVPEVEAFARAHGRELHLEIEPGTYLVANAGALVCTVRDLVSTGAAGHRFIKVDTGMTEVLRPSMYGAQHPLVVVPRDAARERSPGEFLVVGHCCESGDILTPEPGNPEGLAARELVEPQIGDALVIEGAGAYCAGMASKNYNSFPECAELLLDRSGEPHLIRRRQTLDQLLQNEIVQG
jgi:diaminopimelate decarboxylase